MSDNWIPVILFIVVMGIAIAGLYFNSKREACRQETIRAAINHGQELSEDVVKSLNPPKSKNLGLALGIPIMGFSIGLLTLGLGIKETDAAWAAAIPFFLGLGFIAYWYIERKIS